MAVDLKFSNDAKNKMAQGIKKLANAVKVTLGPKGRNVIIEQDFGLPLITNDGVTIAKAIQLEDKYENLGASIITEAAIKTNDTVGDGTSTAILLSSEIIFKGLEAIEKGVNPVTIRKGLEHYLPIIEKSILERSMPVNSTKDLNKIGSLSSSSKEVGNLLEEAYLQVGINGVITLEESSNVQTELVISKGYSFDRGYVSKYFSSDGSNKIELVHPLILITDKKITMMQEIVPFIEEAIKKTRPLLIICEDIDASVLKALIVNKLRGVFNAVVVKTPSYGENKIKLLEDIAIFTKGNFINSMLISDISAANLDVLGSAEKAIITKDETTIMGDYANDYDLKNRIDYLQEEKKLAKTEYEKEKLTSRIAKLSGGVAIISVGAMSEVELKEKKLRIEDAINATKAASKKGIVEGGGKVFYEIAKELEKTIDNSDFKYAKNILIHSLKQPFIQIANNAGKDETIITKVDDKKWYDAENDEIVSLIDAGIIDPTSVTISTITSSISVASVFLTTECAITSIESKTNEQTDLL